MLGCWPLVRETARTTKRYLCTAGLAVKFRRVDQEIALHGILLGLGRRWQPSIGSSRSSSSLHGTRGEPSQFAEMNASRVTIWSWPRPALSRRRSCRSFRRLDLRDDAAFLYGVVGC
jgi:hypothetical protein